MLYSLKPHHHNHNHKKDDHCFEFLNLRQECRQSCSVPGPPQLIQPPESILAIFCIFCAFFAIKKATDLDTGPFNQLDATIGGAREEARAQIS